MSKWQKFQALTWPERLRFFQAVLMLPATALGVEIIGVKRWQSVLDRKKCSGRNAARNLRHAEPVSGKPVVGESVTSLIEARAAGMQEAKNIARLVRAAATHSLYPANCLQQSLVLWWLLKRRGLESEIRFGARKEDEQLQAHAWVECFGLALNEDRGVDERFLPFGLIRERTPVESR